MVYIMLMIQAHATARGHCWYIMSGTCPALPSVQLDQCYPEHHMLWFFCGLHTTFCGIAFSAEIAYNMVASADLFGATGIDNIIDVLLQ